MDNGVDFKAYRFLQIDIRLPPNFASLCGGYKGNQRFVAFCLFLDDLHYRANDIDTMMPLFLTFLLPGGDLPLGQIFFKKK